MYDVSDDWIPIYDKSSLPGYYMAIGTSGNQFKCTGPAGYLMASIIEYAYGYRVLLRLYSRLSLCERATSLTPGSGLL